MIHRRQNNKSSKKWAIDVSLECCCGVHGDATLKYRSESTSVVL